MGILEEFIDKTKTTLFSAMTDVDTCTGLLDALNGTDLVNLIEILGIPSDLALSSRMQCERAVTVVGAAIQAFADFYNASSIQDIVIATCYLVTNESNSDICRGVANMTRSGFEGGCLALLSGNWFIDILGGTDFLGNVVKAFNVSSQMLVGAATSAFEVPQLVGYVEGLIAQVTADKFSVEDTCEAAATVWYNDSTTAAERVDVLLGAAFVELARIAPLICEGRAIAMANGTEDPFEDQTIVITHLGQYENVEAMCGNVSLFNIEDMDNVYVAEFINNTRSTLLSAVTDVDACTGLLDAFSGGDPLGLGIFVSVNTSQLCELLVPVVGVTIETLGDFYNVASIQDVAIATCYLYANENTSWICDDIASESRGMFIASCEGVFTPFNGTLLSLNISNWNETFISILGTMVNAAGWDVVISIFPEVFSNILTSAVNSSDFFNNVIFFISETTYENSTSENVCDAAATVVYNDTMSAEKIVDNILDTTARELARITPVLCGFHTSYMDPLAALWQTTIESVTQFLPAPFDELGNLILLDPVEVLGTIIADLSHHDSFDDLCINVSVIDIEDFVNKTKTTIYIAPKDAGTCESLLDSVSNVTGLTVVGDLLQLPLNMILCDELTGLFNNLTGNNFTVDLYRATNLVEVAETVCMELTNSSVCNLIDSIPRSLFVEGCTQLIGDVDGIDWMAIFTELFDFEDLLSLPGDPFTEIMHLMYVRFGLKDINNGYHVCDASMEFITAEHEEVQDFLRTSVESLVYYTLQNLYFPAACSFTNVSIESTPDFVNILSDIIALIIPDIEENIPLVSICQVLNGSVTDAESANLLRGISATIISTVVDMLKQEDACIVLTGVAFQIFPDDMNVNSTQFCQYLVTSLDSGTANMDNLPMMTFDNPPRPFANPGGFILTMAAQTVLSMFVGVYTSELPIIDTLGITCRQLDSSIKIEAIHDIIDPICSPITEQDHYTMASACRRFMVPQLKHGEDHPVSLRDINVGREFLKALLPLVKYPVWEQSEVVCPAIEALINSKYSLKNLIDEILQHWMNIGIEVAAEVCVEFDDVYEYNKPSNPAQIPEYSARFNALWVAVSNIFDYKTPADLCGDTTTALQLRHFNGIDRLSQTLMRRISDAGSDLRVCGEEVDGVMSLLIAGGMEFGGKIPISFYTGYSSTQEFCVEFVDIMTGKISSSFFFFFNLRATY